MLFFASFLSMDRFAYVVDCINIFLWDWMGLFLFLSVGIWLTIRLGFPQLTQLRPAFKTFFDAYHQSPDGKRGISPLHAFFTSIGGCIGIANLIAVTTVLTQAGVGAVFWLWVGGFIGMAIKYSEVYLSVKLRDSNKAGGYVGGGMWLISKAFNHPFPAFLFALSLAVSGSELYMFRKSLEQVRLLVDGWGPAEAYPATCQILLTGLFIASICYVAWGGIGRVGQVSSVIIPLFVVLFGVLSMGVFWIQRDLLLPTFQRICREAFYPEYAINKGFFGFMSGMWLQMRVGIQRGCYSGDIGIGYAGMAHAQTQEKEPTKVAQMTLIEIIVDTFVVCTCTLLVVLLSQVGYGSYADGSAQVPLITQSFSHLGFWGIDYFMPCLFFLVSYSTLISFFTVGLQCASYLLPRYGRFVYLIYGITIFTLFSFIKDDGLALDLMLVFAGVLLILQTTAIVLLRKELP